MANKPFVSYPMKYLFIPPVVLAVATISALFAVSDVNLALLQSQCHSHAILPSLSRVPVIGTILCTIVAFFQATMDSARSKAIMGVILSLAGSLLTLSTVESARPSNKRAKLVANPTPSWIIVNLLSGAIVWPLLVVPAQLKQSKELLEKGPQPEVEKERNISLSEIISIPISLIVGYYVPSGFMLSLNNIASIMTWQFFPLYVSAVRIGIRYVIERFWPQTKTITVHLEANRRGLAAVYALPSLLSLISHVTAFWSLTWPEDRKELTRSLLPIVEIDVTSMLVATLYWAFAEVGWKVPLSMVGASAVFGPGAGVLGGWVLREKVIRRELAGTSDAENPAGADEETPLLR